jgi:magnesium transporter
MSTRHSKRGKRVRSNLRFRRRTAPGNVPGAVVVDPGAPHPVVRVISYGPDDLDEEVVTNLDHLAGLVGRRPVTWVDVQGLGDAATIHKLGEIFSFHPLALEDVVNTHQRAKVEDYGSYLFVVARIAVPDGQLATEQISMFLGKDFVVTFQEKPCEVFDPILKRIRLAQCSLRGAGADHLAYALLDAAVDGYFPVLEECGERLDAIDDELSLRPTRDAMLDIRDLRRELLTLRRAIWPFRDALSLLASHPGEFVTDKTRVYLRDCYDHTVQIIDLIETCREMCSDLRDFYLSAVSNRMSETMKVLTVIATIFMPMTFIAGLYGMNFDPDASPWNMPELLWRFGYPWALALMAAVAVGQLYFFWRRGWLGR